MKNLIKLIFILPFLILLFYYHTSYGAINSLEELRKTITEKRRNLTDFSCDFIQTKKLKMFARPITVKGKLFIRATKGMRLEIFEPMPATLILTKDKMIRCDESGNKAVISFSNSKIAKQIAQDVSSWMTLDLDALDKRYKVRYLNPGSASPLLEILPKVKNTKRLIKKMDIRLNGSTLLPESIEIKHTDGDLTEFLFSGCTAQEERFSTDFTLCR